MERRVVVVAWKDDVLMLLFSELSGTYLVILDGIRKKIASGITDL